MITTGFELLRQRRALAWGLWVSFLTTALTQTWTPVCDLAAELDWAATDLHVAHR
jgi:hypothetical protein